MKIIVTDLTRFTNPDIVCLAGIDLASGATIRPMIKTGSKTDYLPLSWVKKHNVLPGSFLEGDFIAFADPAKPHTEDHIIDGSFKTNGYATSAEFEDILAQSATQTIRAGFGARPISRSFESPEYPEKSICTLRLTDPKNQFRLVIDDKFGDKKFKAHITDGENFNISWLPVTDLGFFIHLKETIKADPTLSNLNHFLHQQKTIYLRIGLTRPWSKPSESKEKCWTQLNGIYSFPDFRESFRTYE